MDPYYYITKNPSYKIDTLHEHIHFDKIINSGLEIFTVIESLLHKYNVNVTTKHKILDYACGYGRLAILLALKYNKVYVYDFVKEYCNILSNNASLLNIENIHIFDSSIDITKHKYSLITAIDFLFYYIDSLQEIYLKYLLELLDVNGILCVSLYLHGAGEMKCDVTNLKLYEFGYMNKLSNILRQNDCMLLEYNKDTNIACIKRIKTTNQQYVLTSDKLTITSPRNIPISNKYVLKKKDNDDHDFHCVIYYIDKKCCHIRITRLDDNVGWNFDMTLEIESLDGTFTEQICIKHSDILNDKYVNQKTILNSIELGALNLEYDQVIPKKIIQTMEHNKVSLQHFKTVQTLKELNPEYEYVFYNANDRRNFIKTHFNSDVLDTYDGLLYGAFKADIFRYCYLYIHGGCYIDCKMIGRTPLRNIITSKLTSGICIDRINNAFQNNVILTVPKNPMMKNCIDLCVERFKKKIHQQQNFGSLYHTGPFLFYTAIREHLSEDNLIFRYSCPFHEKNYRNSKIVGNNDGETYFNTFYKNYYDNYSDIHKTQNWCILWANGLIYNSQKYHINNLIIMIHPISYNKCTNDQKNEIEFEKNSDEIFITKPIIEEGLLINIIDDDTNEQITVRVYNKKRTKNQHL